MRYNYHNFILSITEKWGDRVTCQRSCRKVGRQLGIEASFPVFGAVTTKPTFLSGLPHRIDQGEGVSVCAPSLLQSEMFLARLMHPIN